VDFGEEGGTYLADEFDFVTFDFLDAQDVELCEEMEREIVDGVAQDRLLNKQDVALCLFDLFDHVE